MWNLVARSAEIRWIWHMIQNIIYHWYDYIWYIIFHICFDLHLTVIQNYQNPSLRCCSWLSRGCCDHLKERFFAPAITLCACADAPIVPRVFANWLCSPLYAAPISHKMHCSHIFSPYSKRSICEMHTVDTLFGLVLQGPKGGLFHCVVYMKVFV